VDTASSAGSGIASADFRGEVEEVELRECDDENRKMEGKGVTAVGGNDSPSGHNIDTDADSLGRSHGSIIFDENEGSGGMALS